MITAAVLIIVAYLLGSLSTAVIVGRLLGAADPRTQGSGNPGATNMLRVAGKKAGVLTLLGDMLKGLVAVLIARAFTDEPAVLAAVMLAAFLGHLYPVFFGFRGGKGVATALGVLLGLSGWIGLAAVVTWLLVAVITRISSLSALVTAAAAPLYTFYWLGEPVLAGAVTLMALLLFWRHRSNIRNLMDGTEGRINLGKRS
ncbi:acyl-phosphate glycerol 3-phosphateacyltransferase [Thiohalobacter thiocyanaticus]|uniref:Glycerol-3-phosphate acyltransferase n=1 Tax=Thiohalobacter thiocyanaticus TaxID=585455 RepID=A0A1Z4VNN5_9GAMM|nr:glycerol-3-phosphate 1-O-acyltransferase PlsY [Thiohalobacter thiocyanaticus]BAZ92844.1 acyl-phosphate glycerol 3-phosphateacyltransferase [Thiohalobacter thiocyanaticus]